MLRLVSLVLVVLDRVYLLSPRPVQSLMRRAWRAFDHWFDSFSRDLMGDMKGGFRRGPTN